MNKHELAVTDRRKVLLICGPPGAGKTTRARQIAQAERLEVFDRDDTRWRGDDRAYLAALAALGRDPAARAVVIRSGSTRARRAQVAALCGATACELLIPPYAACAERVQRRRRGDWRATLAGVIRWYREYDEDKARPSPTSRAW